MTRVEYEITAMRVDAHASVVRCKEAEIDCDTDVQGRVDVFNPAELLLAAVAAGKTRNISAGGVFVDTGYRPTNGSRCLDIEFVMSDEAGTATDLYHVKGMAVHSTRAGIGLMIDDFDLENRLPVQRLSAG